MPYYSSENRVKENILALENEILALKQVILRQNEIIKQLSERVLDLSSKLEELEKSPNQPISTGNDGVNQSINHLINQSLINQSLNHIPLITENEPVQDTQLDDFSVTEPSEVVEKEPLITSKTAAHKEQKLLSTSPAKKEQDFNIDLGTRTQKPVIEEEISLFRININKLFSSLSKQELRIFLTLYQLDDDTNGVSYTELASKTELTEPCIRGYVSFLIKKGLPIARKKLNNRRTILTIQKDFKSLGLKQKLVSLYYESDPHQRTLFDIN